MFIVADLVSLKEIEKIKQSLSLIFKSTLHILTIVKRSSVCIPRSNLLKYILSTFSRFLHYFAEEEIGGSFVLYNFYEKACTFVHIGILGQVWYLIVSIPDLCTLTYIVSMQLSILHFKL